MISRRILAASIAVVLAAGISGCGEVDQTSKTQKVYAGKKDERAYDNKVFGSDKQKWESAMVQRSRTQNEYLRTDQK